MAGEHDDTDDSASIQSENPTALSQATAVDPYKVRGLNDSDASGGDNPTGVLGRATGSGQTYGVQGVTDSDGNSLDSTFPAGVYGSATGSGSNYGVHGTTSGTDAYAAGVKAEASGVSAKALTAENLLGLAIHARSNANSAPVAQLTKGVGATSVLWADHQATPSSGSTTGVLGTVESGNQGSVGVVGRANAKSGETHGVEGITRSVDADASGLRGEAVGNYGQVYGVAGTTKSTDPNAAGVYASASGDAPAVKADGHVDVSSVGVSAYLGSTQNINNASTTVVSFDTLVSGQDDFSGLDTNTGEYAVSQAGDYHVSAAVEWANKFDGGTDHEISVLVNGSTVARLFRQVDGTSNNSSWVADHITKTLFGLSPTDTIEVAVYQETGTNQDLATGRIKTYLTIHKVG